MTTSNLPEKTATNFRLFLDPNVKIELETIGKVRDIDFHQVARRGLIWRLEGLSAGRELACMDAEPHLFPNSAVESDSFEKKMEKIKYLGTFPLEIDYWLEILAQSTGSPGERVSSFTHNALQRWYNAYREDYACAVDILDMGSDTDFATVHAECT